MKNHFEFHRYIIIILFGLLFLFSSTIFPQQYKTKYDTVDCSKYSCEQWGMKNASCRDLDLEQWPAHCASCRQLSLFLQEKFDELDYDIYNSVWSCTIVEVECELAQELGFIPSMRSESIYPGNIFSSENKTYQGEVYKFKISNGWVGDTFISSKIIIEKPQGEGYAHVKIGSGKCGIKKKISYVNNGYDDSVPGLSVGISGGETPIATAQMIMGRLDSRLESNYKMARSYIYDQLNNATNRWTDEDIQGAIRSIKWNYSDSRMAVGMCEDDYFGKLDDLIQTGIMVELDEPIPQIEESLIDESNKITEELGEIDKIGEDSLGVVTTGDIPNKEEVLKNIVCASAKPSFTGGSQFKRAKFTIGGTEPQRIKITSSAENFAIKKEYGGLVYQVIDGTSWGNLTLEPGSYILSCNGGGAMGLMSATVCIENPVAGQVLPSDIPPVLPRPGDDDKPILIDSKPQLPKGPIEKIFVRSAESDDDINNDHLIMLIREEKNITVWGEDAAGHKMNVTVDDWKIYDDDIGWIIEGLHNPAPKGARVKIKFKAGDKKGYTRIKATVINKENRRINGVLFIEVTEDPPITVMGRLKLCNEYNSPIYPSGVMLALSAKFFENREDLITGSYVTWDNFVSLTDATGKFKFIVPISGKFALLYCSITHVPPAPTGYDWVHGPPPPQYCAGQSDESTWKGKIDSGTTIHIKPEQIFLDKEWPSPIKIYGTVNHRGKSVDGAIVRLVGNSKTLEESVSDYGGEYSLDVGNLPNGKYLLTAKYKPTIDDSKPSAPGNYVTLSNWLITRKDIPVVLPLQTQEKNIDIELISWKEKIGYSGP